MLHRQDASAAVVLQALASEGVAGIDHVEIHSHGTGHCGDCGIDHVGRKLLEVRDFASALGVALAFGGVSREVRRKVLCHQPSGFEHGLPWGFGLLKTHSAVQQGRQMQGHRSCLIQRLHHWAWVA